jgi:hypothetical protein
MSMVGLDKPILTTVVIGAGLVSGILGCGSSSGDSPTPGPLTRAQFVKAGNRICQGRLEEKDEIIAEALKGLPSSRSNGPSRDDLTELGESIFQPVQRMADELDELPAPLQGEAAIKAITQELEAGLKQAESDPSILVRTDPFRKAGESARAYGLKSCTF